MNEPMSVADAAHATVHDYPGGAACLATRMGMNPVVLNSKVNPNTTTHHLMLLEAQRMMGLTGDYRILRAQCDELGFLPPVRRVTVEVSDAALLETYTKLISELGEFSTKFHAALADGKVTKKELGRLRKEMGDFFAAGEELLTRVEQITER